MDVQLPAVEGEPAAGGGVGGSPALASGGETILVVEDDGAVRRLTCRMLSRRGYRVLEAADGRAALSAWTEHEGAIDLLLTDVLMPESRAPSWPNGSAWSRCSCPATRPT